MSTREEAFLRSELKKLGYTLTIKQEKLISNNIFKSKTLPKGTKSYHITNYAYKRSDRKIIFSAEDFEELYDELDRLKTFNLVNNDTIL